jgi:hypothetical protein
LHVQFQCTFHDRFWKEGTIQLNSALSSVRWRMHMPKVWFSFLTEQNLRASRNTSGCEFYMQVFCVVINHCCSDRGN